MQVDPIKPMVKAPGSNLLTLKHDELPSSFAFKFNLRRYEMECLDFLGENDIPVTIVFTKAGLAPLEMDPKPSTLNPKTVEGAYHVLIVILTFIEPQGTHHIVS